MAGSPGPEDRGAAKRSPQQNGQLVPAKPLGAPTVYVEALAADGAVVVEKVESEVALLWPFVQKEVVLNKRGKTPENPVQLPKQVGQDILALLLEYCRYHRFPGRSDKERKLFDEKFIRLDTRRLCELTSAADSLDMKPLVDLSSRALARMIEGKTPEEIRETFHLPDDLTEEEKLEPVRNLADDPRIRLLNRLYAKKRKELADKKAELVRKENGHQQPRPSGHDTRSVEELLNFIGEDGSTKGPRGTKKKKPKKKREAGREGFMAGASGEGASSDSSPPRKGGSSRPSSPAPPTSADETFLADPRKSLEAANGCTGEADAELDNEVEAFERRLNAPWEDHKAELILSAGAYQGRHTRVTMLTSLSNFKARPRDMPLPEESGQDSPGWSAIAADVPAAADVSTSPIPNTEGPGASGRGNPDAAKSQADESPDTAASDDGDVLEVGGGGEGEELEDALDDRLSDEPRGRGLAPALQSADVRKEADGHRKAVPKRAQAYAASERGGTDEAPRALAAMLTRFVEELGYAGCVQVSTGLAPTPPRASDDECCVIEGLVPGLGRVKLELEPL